MLCSLFLRKIAYGPGSIGWIPGHQRGSLHSRNGLHVDGGDDKRLTRGGWGQWFGVQGSLVNGEKARFNRRRFYGGA